MSTYAEWRLWVGVRMEDIDLDTIPDTTYEILDTLYEKPRKIQRLKIEHISNGVNKSGGIGVIIRELGWNYELDDQNIFDLKKVAEAQRMVTRLQEVFDQLGIKAKVRIMHHVDLGG